MLKNYFQVREWLERFIPYTYSKENLGLERIENLLKLLGNPQEKFQSILIGGTSGKGSTAYYLARALREAQKQETRNKKQETNSGFSSFKFQVSSLKIGLHISPHLSYIGERMQTFNRVRESESQRVKVMEGPISVKRLVGLICEIRPVVESIKSKQPHLTPSYFEILVAVSFLYFAQEKVDIAVVEVGLGGRLDATNVLQSRMSVITNVGLDHTDILGKTVEEIAKEKAGIIKRSKVKGQRSKVVTGAGSRALKVIENYAKSKKSEVYTINTLMREDKRYYDLLRNNKIMIDINNSNKLWVTDECFFLVNLALGQLGIGLSANEQKKVFSARFEGRFEEIDDGILIDGAHNKDKARALIKWVQRYRQLSIDNRQSSKIILVCAFKKGKDWKGILKLLLKKFDIERVYATQFVTPTDTGFFSSVEPEEIRDFVAKVQSAKCKVYRNSQEAVWEAVRERDKGGKWVKRVKGYKGSKSVILNTSLTLSMNSMKDLKLRDSSLNRAQNDNTLVLITGSLYLAGEARMIWHLPSF